MEQPRLEPFDFEGPGPRSTRLTALVLAVLILGVVTFVLVTALHAMASRAGVSAYAAPRLYGPGASFHYGGSTWRVLSGHWVVRGTEVRVPSEGEGRVEVPAAAWAEAAIALMARDSQFRLGFPDGNDGQYWLALNGDGRFALRQGDALTGKVLFSGIVAPTESGQVELRVYRTTDLLHVRVSGSERVIPAHLTWGPLAVVAEGGEVRIHRWSVETEERE